MKVKLTEFGSLRAMADQEAALFAESSHREMGAIGDDVKKAVRANIREAKFRGAAKLANAWRGKLFPRSPKAHAARPAYVIGNNAPNILDTFERGGIITAKGGALLVPIGPAARFKLPPFTARSKLPELMLRQYGVSRFVSHKMRNGRIALGVFTAKEGGPRKFVPLFELRRSVTAPKLLKAAEIIEATAKDMPNRHAAGTFQRFDASLARLGRDGAVVSRVTQAG